MKIGLVLSGGVARGIAHLGVLKFLQEKKIPIDYISAVSAGSIFGAFFAANYSAERIIEILKEVNFFKIMRLSFSSSGFLNSVKIQELYEKYLPKTFEQLDIPLWVSATDVGRGKTMFFNSGDLYKPILASCSVPAIFQPVKIEGTYLVDGGILNNLPVEPLIDKCDRIIGVHVNPTDDRFGSFTMAKISTRCIELAVRCNVESRRNYCDLYIEPQKLKTFSMYSLNKIDELIEIGYEAILKKWDDSIFEDAD